eukprot:CAMPEP_0181291814 /NCGR_PEP_ID=MMETSP1101-20121128/2171_1 /TAXON_ID=46948 /ORGANISM="Rhodomonas abbreviata, Strain Caron Lab Isolate" /LENGTH=507 /DNA_ID=CAMNT_0023396237 /DNA_START=164 /DNA_END=1683 /DNA_ORIENTATION=-
MGCTCLVWMHMSPRSLLLGCFCLALLSTSGSHEFSSPHTDLVAGQLDAGSFASKDPWIRRLLDSRRGGNGENAESATMSLDGAHARKRRSTLLEGALPYDLKLASDGQIQTSLNSIEISEWAQNYRCFLFRAQAAVDLLYDQAVNQTEVLRVMCEEDSRQCKADLAAIGDELVGMQDDLAATSHSLRTWKRILGGVKRKQSKHDEEMTDSSEQKARSMIKNLDAALEQQHQHSAAKQALRRAYELRCGMISWRQAVHSRATLQTRESLSRTRQQLVDLEKEVGLVESALTRFQTKATSAICSMEGNILEEGQEENPHVRFNQNLRSLVLSLGAMQMALHGASDQGYKGLTTDGQRCKELHSKVERSRKRLFAGEDDRVEIETAMEAKRKVLFRLRQEIDASHQAAADAKAKASALEQRMGTAGLGAEQTHLCQEGVRHMRAQEAEARQEALEREEAMQDPEAQYHELAGLLSSTVSLNAAMHKDLETVEQLARECDEGVVRMRQDTG